MPKVKLDHCVIHVSQWDRSNAFYRDVMGADVIQMANRWVYRFGDTQLNLHGPGLDAAPVARLPVQRAMVRVCISATRTDRFSNSFPTRDEGY